MHLNFHINEPGHERTLEYTLSVPIRRAWFEYPSESIAQELHFQFVEEGVNYMIPADKSGRFSLPKPLHKKKVVCVSLSSDPSGTVSPSLSDAILKSWYSPNL